MARGYTCLPANCTHRCRRLWSGCDQHSRLPIHSPPAKIKAVTPRLLAIDIDGTLLNSQFQISPENLHALKRTHERGIEVVLVTGRRHTFALPIAQQLGFDLWLISSNGAVTKSLTGELFHRDLMPAETARRLCRELPQFTKNLVITFDQESKGAIVLERLDELTA